MSTGADCRIYEKTPKQWYYDLQDYPYGHTESYQTKGPFKTFDAAVNHLHQHHANPGGYWVDALPGCPHDLVASSLYGGRFCRRCGDPLDLPEAT